MGNAESASSDYVLDDPLPLDDVIDDDVAWKLHHAITKDGTQHMSVFAYDATTAPEAAKKHMDQYIDNAIKYIRVLRHPGIIKLLDIERNGGVAYILTEKLTPLSLALENLSCDEICAGLHNVVVTLAFLHETGGLCHNNICASSIFVAEDGSWKIGSMEHMCRFQDVTASYLKKWRHFRCEKAMPAEEKGALPDQKLYGHTRDAFAFGVLAEELLEYLTELGDMTKTFELRIQDEFLNDNPRERPHLSTLLEDRLFKNDFTEIMNFLKNLTLKSTEEKDQFFRTVVGKLRKISPELIATRLVHPLLARFVLCESGAEDFLLPHLLTPLPESANPDVPVRRHYQEVNPVLPERLFRKYVVPQIFKIFHVRDANVRNILLRHFPGYVHCFEPEVLRKVLMPQILVGLRDTDSEIVYFTMHALADLVPILGGATVIGGAQAKIFSQGKPKFMTRNAEPQNDVKSSLPTNLISPPKQSGVKGIDLTKQAQREAKKKKVPTATLH